MGTTSVETKRRKSDGKREWLAGVVEKGETRERVNGNVPCRGGEGRGGRSRHGMS